LNKKETIFFRSVIFIHFWGRVSINKTGEAGDTLCSPSTQLMHIQLFLLFVNEMLIEKPVTSQKVD
jgi:hypothetical protein